MTDFTSTNNPTDKRREKKPVLLFHSIETLKLNRCYPSLVDVNQLWNDHSEHVMDWQIPNFVLKDSLEYNLIKASVDKKWITTKKSTNMLEELAKNSMFTDHRVFIVDTFVFFVKKMINQILSRHVNNEIRQEQQQQQQQNNQSENNEQRQNVIDGANDNASQKKRKPRTTTGSTTAITNDELKKKKKKENFEEQTISMHSQHDITKNAYTHSSIYKMIAEGLSVEVSKNHFSDFTNTVWFKHFESLMVKYIRKIVKKISSLNTNVIVMKTGSSSHASKCFTNGNNSAGVGGNEGEEQDQEQGQRQVNDEEDEKNTMETIPIQSKTIVSIVENLLFRKLLELPVKKVFPNSIMQDMACSFSEQLYKHVFVQQIKFFLPLYIQFLASSMTMTTTDGCIPLPLSGTCNAKNVHDFLRNKSEFKGLIMKIRMSFNIDNTVLDLKHNHFLYTYLEQKITTPAERLCGGYTKSFRTIWMNEMFVHYLNAMRKVYDNIFEQQYEYFKNIVQSSSSSSSPTESSTTPTPTFIHPSDFNMLHITEKNKSTKRIIIDYCVLVDKFDDNSKSINPWRDMMNFSLEQCNEILVKKENDKCRQRNSAADVLYKLMIVAAYVKSNDQFKLALQCLTAYNVEKNLHILIEYERYVHEQQKRQQLEQVNDSNHQKKNSLLPADRLLVENLEVLKKYADRKELHRVELFSKHIDLEPFIRTLEIQSLRLKNHLKDKDRNDENLYPADADVDAESHVLDNYFDFSEVYKQEENGIAFDMHEYMNLLLNELSSTTATQKRDGRSDDVNVDVDDEAESKKKVKMFVEWYADSVHNAEFVVNVPSLQNWWTMTHILIWKQIHFSELYYINVLKPLYSYSYHLWKPPIPPNALITPSDFQSVCNDKKGFQIFNQYIFDSVLTVLGIDFFRVLEKHTLKNDKFKNAMRILTTMQSYNTLHVLRNLHLDHNRFVNMIVNTNLVDNLLTDMPNTTKKQLDERFVEILFSFEGIASTECVNPNACFPMTINSSTATTTTKTNNEVNEFASTNAALDFFDHDIRTLMNGIDITSKVIFILYIMLMDFEKVLFFDDRIETIQEIVEQSHTFGRYLVIDNDNNNTNSNITKSTTDSQQHQQVKVKLESHDENKGLRNLMYNRTFKGDEDEEYVASQLADSVDLMKALSQGQTVYNIAKVGNKDVFLILDEDMIASSTYSTQEVLVHDEEQQQQQFEFGGVEVGQKRRREVDDENDDDETSHTRSKRKINVQDLVLVQKKESEKSRREPTTNNNNIPTTTTTTMTMKNDEQYSNETRPPLFQTKRITSDRAVFTPAPFATKPNLLLYYYYLFLSLHRQQWLLFESLVQTENKIVFTQSTWNMAMQAYGELFRCEDFNTQQEGMDTRPIIYTIDYHILGRLVANLNSILGEVFKKSKSGRDLIKYLELIRLKSIRLFYHQNLNDSYLFYHTKKKSLFEHDLIEWNTNTNAFAKNNVL